MDLEVLQSYCLAKAGTTESCPFHKAPNVLVYKVAGKMFLATDIAEYDSITIKCDPNEVEEMRATHMGVTEPPYLSKKHWNTVQLDGSIPIKLLQQWIDTSYNIVVAGLTKKERQMLQDSTKQVER